MRDTKKTESNKGFSKAVTYSLLDAIFDRRSRRISQGITSVPAGSLSYSSDKAAQPLCELEEAMLIAVLGLTGRTLPDMPLEDENGNDLLGTPMLNIRGRSAGSPDNAQATSFIMTNDTGTYLLKKVPPQRPLRTPEGGFDEAALLSHAARSKQKILDHRLDFPREVPAYFGRNKFVSNLKGTTVFFPIVDLTRQYINGIMFLLSQPAGSRPNFIDDWSFYRSAGCKKWVKSKFLNKDIKIPLGLVAEMRIPFEASFLLQNMFLTLQAMGLGGWIHACPVGPILLGSPEFQGEFGKGLGFRFEKPKGFFRKLHIPFTPLPAWKPNPVGLDGVIEGCCPPYHKTMDDAVDAIVQQKYGSAGVYADKDSFETIFKNDMGDQFLAQAPHVRAEIIECTKDVCNYIYKKYGRFPAHADAFYVPGVCLQAHHLDLDYYDQLFKNGYTTMHKNHSNDWHN